jgi:hypothetical protein
MGQNFHTEFKYEDSFNKGISIQNSFPKGGLKYKALNGNDYIYLVFWKRTAYNSAHQKFGHLG